MENTKRTAFEKDSNSSMAELYLAVLEYTKECLGSEVKTRYNPNTTTLFTKEGGYCYIRAYDTYVHIGWTRGKYIDDRYDFLFGDGKTIRGQRITKLDKKVKESIKYYVNETLVFLIEHNEMMKMRTHAKKKRLKEVDFD